MNQITGEIVEELISIKKRFYNELYSTEIEAINNACNILTHRFNRFDSTNTLINEHITSIHWQRDDIMTALEEQGYESNETNVNIVFNYLGLEKYLQEYSTEAGWEVIYNIISENKNVLKEKSNDKVQN